VSSRGWRAPSSEPAAITRDQRSARGHPELAVHANAPPKRGHAHFPSPGWGAALAERVVEPLARYPNIHADTSGVRRFDYLVKAVRRAGPHELLFGSDGPWLQPGLELAKARLLGLSPEDEALVVGRNALRLRGARWTHPRRGVGERADPPRDAGRQRPPDERREAPAGQAPLVFPRAQSP
jgi:hypothetical protein